jgi:hypothetical protein
VSPSESLRPEMERIQRMALIVGAVALALCLIELFIDRYQFFQSYLFAFLFWNALSIGSLGIYLMHNVVGGNWGVVIRRFLEAGSKTFPLTFLFILPILIFAIPTLYLWARPEGQSDPIIHLKLAYLNVPFFIGRALFYFAFWILVALRLSRISNEQDRTGDLALTERMRAFSAPSLLVFVLVATFAFFDWIMSLEPLWYSTVYGAMFLVGQMLETFAFAIALLVILSKRKPFVDVLKIQHFHDLGNLMLAFTMLWAYLSLSQFLIIWAANLPEEIPWYIRRFTGGWGVLGVIVGIFHFCVPFVLLLMRFIKKNPRLLYKVAIYMIFIRFIDVFWIVEPAFRQRQFWIHWMDIVAPIGMGGIWIWAFLAHLKAKPLLPLHDPRLGYHSLETEV